MTDKPEIGSGSLNKIFFQNVPWGEVIKGVSMESCKVLGALSF